ncbi:MAG TPA: universal stress protein [Polyangiaceae bacterium]|jgi:nucleotide-binding universal stress UspA family protein|nr:universal stress protein [Polyangiaceae bacterium]
MSGEQASFQRILVPVDLSEASLRSLRYALALGSLFGSVVDALHVWRTSTQTAVTAARDGAKQALRQFVASLELGPGAELRRMTDYGDPYLTILRIAGLSSYNLIVSFPPEPGRAAPENVALSLMHGSRVPVLMVPRNWAAGVAVFDLEQQLTRILLPAAFADRSRLARSSAARLEQACGAVVETLQEEPGQVETALLARAAKADYDLFVLCVQRARLGETERDHSAERLLLAQQCPTLCVHADE